MHDAPPATRRPLPLEAALDRVGDRWSLLLVEALLDGSRRFGDLDEALPGIAPNILTDRLRRLVEHGLLDKHTATSGRRQVYALTPAGRDLFAVIVSLRQWGERHAYASAEAHSLLVDEHGQPLPELRPIDSHGNPATLETTSVEK